MKLSTKIIFIIFTLIPQRVNIKEVTGSSNYTELKYVWLGRAFKFRIKKGHLEF